MDGRRQADGLIRGRTIRIGRHGWPLRQRECRRHGGSIQIRSSFLLLARDGCGSDGECAVWWCGGRWWHSDGLRAAGWWCCRCCCWWLVVLLVVRLCLRLRRARCRHELAELIHRWRRRCGQSQRDRRGAGRWCQQRRRRRRKDFSGRGAGGSIGGHLQRGSDCNTRAEKRECVSNQAHSPRSTVLDQGPRRLPSSSGGISRVRRKQRTSMNRLRPERACTQVSEPAWRMVDPRQLAS